MRTIVYGVGAIGGTVAAALALSGQEVIGIARGAQLDAIRDRGLLLRTPEGARARVFRCVGDPAEIDWRPDDAVLLTMKTQDTTAALERLRAAGVAGQAIFCVQNGVANERMALRRFPERARGDGDDAGRLRRRRARWRSSRRRATASSTSAAFRRRATLPTEALAAALEAANVAAFVSDDVMASKYGKLLLNLNNIVEAALGPGRRTSGFQSVLRARGRGGAGRGGDRLARRRRRRSAPRGADAAAARSPGSSGRAAPRPRASRAAPARSRPTS